MTFPSTDLPNLKDKEDTQAVRKSILDLLDKINQGGSLPVGYVYTQYPGQSDPATLFGGTWLNITSLYAGLFFRAEGGNALAFGAGTQTDAFQGHYHDVILRSSNATGSPGYITIANSGAAIPGNPGIGSPINDGTLSTAGNPVRTASETRPVNQSIRIWKKSGTSGGAGTTSVTTNSGIYDSGTNANGSWIRFTDGTMMCWARVTMATSNTTSITFPQPFIDATYSLTGNGIHTTGTYVSFLQEESSPARTSTTVSLIANATTGSGTYSYSWQATGKWK